MKYYDFTEMTYEISNKLIPEDEELSIELFATDVEYLSLNLVNIEFTSALAFNCDDGWGGMKHPFEKIEITSSADFNNELSANNDLTEMFLIRTFTGNGNFEFKSIGETNFEEFPTTNMEFLLRERPTVDNKHTFTIRMTKSNSEEIVLEIEEIIWQ